MVKNVDPDLLAKAMNDPAAVRASTVGRSTYHRNRVNYCPGCDRTQWWVGRVTAECAFCHTAIPLSEPPTSGTGRKGVIGR